MDSSTQKLIIKENDEDDPTCATFVLRDEDHTLGNALRLVLVKSPEVIFCGYTIPHPSQPTIEMRLQTTGPPAVDMLKKGLNDLKEMVDHVSSVYESELQAAEMR